MHLTASQRSTVLAPWSLRIVLLALQLVLATAVLHRFAAFPTAVAVNLMLLSFAGCALAVLLAILALVQIWRHGSSGTGAAASALLVGGLLLIVPAYYLPLALRDTPIADVATDRSHPPAYQALGRIRLAAGIDPSVPPVTTAGPDSDLEPIVTTRSPGDVFDLTNDIMRQLDFNIVAEEAPGFSSEDGTIEATERTAVLGLTDDISIRISPDNGQTRIDLRSAARYPGLDFGRNAERARMMVRKLQSSIDANVPADPALAANAPLAAEADAGDAKKPSDTSGAATVLRRKKRSPVPAGAPSAPGQTTSRH